MSGKSKVLAILGGTVLALGVGILCFTYVYIRALTHHSMWFLQKFYDSGRMEQVGYDELFSYASQITAHRNSLAVGLFSTIGVLTVLLGFILILWSRDRKVDYQG